MLEEMPPVAVESAPTSLTGRKDCKQKCHLSPFVGFWIQDGHTLAMARMQAGALQSALGPLAYVPVNQEVNDPHSGNLERPCRCRNLLGSERTRTNLDKKRHSLVSDASCATQWTLPSAGSFLLAALCSATHCLRNCATLLCATRTCTKDACRSRAHSCCNLLTAFPHSKNEARYRLHLKAATQ